MCQEPGAVIAAALTDVVTGKTFIFHHPPWTLEKLKCGLGGCRVTLVKSDGERREIVVNAPESTVRARFSRWSKQGNG